MMIKKGVLVLVVLAFMVVASFSAMADDHVLRVGATPVPHAEILEFIQDESCGKCVPCREGTRHMLMLLEKIAAGEAEMKDLKLLERLAYSIEDSALCGLGQTAPNPVLSSLRYFKDEYIAHINDKRCPAGQCSALGGYSVQPDICIGCAKCIKECPHDAIEERTVTPERDEDKKKAKKLAVVNSSKCNECGICIEECPVEAIIKR